MPPLPPLGISRPIPEFTRADPAHDLQAIDRAFRIGQSRDVEVFRLLGAGSIEELMYARQVYKQQQMRIGYDASIQTRSVDTLLLPSLSPTRCTPRYFEGVQNDKERQGELFGLQNIFKLHKDTLATKIAVGYLISLAFPVVQEPV